MSVDGCLARLTVGLGKYDLVSPLRSVPRGLSSVMVPLLTDHVRTGASHICTAWCYQ